MTPRAKIKTISPTAENSNSIPVVNDREQKVLDSIYDFYKNFYCIRKGLKNMPIAEFFDKSEYDRGRIEGKLQMLQLFMDTFDNFERTLGLIYDEISDYESFYEYCCECDRECDDNILGLDKQSEVF